MVKVPLYQRILRWILYGLAGFLAVGSLLDSISNAISLVSPPVTYVGSVAILVLWFVVERLLRAYPMRWIATGGQEVRLRGLGVRTRIGLIGAILLLWIPRTIEIAKFNDNTTLPSPTPSTHLQSTAPVSTQTPVPSTSTPTPTPTLTPVPVTPTSTPAQSSVIQHPGMVNLLDVNQQLPAGWVTRGQFTYWEGYIHIQNESSIRIVVKGCEDDEGNGWLDLIQVIDPEGNAVVYKVNCRISYEAAVNTHGKAGYYRIYLHDNDTSSSDGNGGTLEVDMLQDQIIYVNPP